MKPLSMYYFFIKIKLKEKYFYDLKAYRNKKYEWSSQINIILLIKNKILKIIMTKLYIINNNDDKIVFLNEQKREKCAYEATIFIRCFYRGIWYILHSILLKFNEKYFYIWKFAETKKYERNS